MGPGLKNISASGISRVLRGDGFPCRSLSPNREGVRIRKTDTGVTVRVDFFDWNDSVDMAGQIAICLAEKGYVVSWQPGSIAVYVADVARAKVK